MTNPRAKYMTPMRLWSTLVSHSRHRDGHQPSTVTSPSTARMTMTTTAALIIGSGSLSGIAAQVNLPSISTPCLRRRTPGRAGARLFGPCRRLVDDALEQLWLDRAIGRRRRGFARLCQLRVAGIVERRPGPAHPSDPGIEIAGRNRLGDKPHLGQAVAAEICR